MRRLLLSALLISACRGSSLDADGGPDPGGPGSSEGATPCDSTSDCGKDEICAAPYDGQGIPGDFVCMAECIEADVAELWCADDQACCAGLDCDMLGYCIDPDGTTSG